MNNSTQNPLTTPGAFLIGCNYWASHAGTAMWSDWQPEIVEADMRQLAQAGLQVLRVFPLWSDFQPIHQLYGGAGRPQQVRFGEALLPEDETGQAGMSIEMLERFGCLADLAEKYGLKLIVGLLTGWMSGRLFAPPALQGLNLLTDPTAIQWEVRFVRCFVKHFKDHPAILAWDLGNECNCIAPVPSAAAAWSWTATITGAIRSEDHSRPIVSGMHSLDEPDDNGPWRIRHQAELLEVLTTHPYPYFTPHCDQDPVNTLRNLLHATAQTRWYGDCGNRPALAEEVGTLGPGICSEAIAADYLRTNLFSLWAHDCHGLLWWCAYDQAHLAHAPYDWAAFERELGLFRIDRSPKPVVEEFQRFRRFLEGLPFKALPPRLTEGVCILSHGQEPWGAAYASFILAKQAGFDLTFQYPDQPLRPSALYLVPSASGGASLPRHLWLQLLENVRQGATLYLSHADCVLSAFKEAFGLEIQTRQKRHDLAEICLSWLPGMPTLTLDAPVRLDLRPVGAEVLGSEQDNNPAFTRYDYGKGQVFFLSAPIEIYLSNTPGAFHGAGAQPFWRIYQRIADRRLGQRILHKEHPYLGMTEHPLDKSRRVAALINYSPDILQTVLHLADGWQVIESWHGALPKNHRGAIPIELPANQALVWLLTEQ